MPPTSQPYIDITVGQLRVRLARTETEIRQAQALRYQIFYNEMGARTSEANADTQLDIDAFDKHCDHLLVFDTSLATPKVVGTYRLLCQDVALRNHGFYSSTEFDLTPLIQSSRGSGLLELGRSCIASDYRNAATISLLWRGIAAYVSAHRITHMFGCASFQGTNPQEHASELSYLYNRHLAQPEWRAQAIKPVPLSQFVNIAYDQRTVTRRLPPLLKAYLRLGAVIGESAYIDTQFNTLDVLVLVPVQSLSQRYMERFDMTTAQP